MSNNTILIIEDSCEEIIITTKAAKTKAPAKKNKKTVNERNINETTQFVVPIKTIIVNGEWICQLVPCVIQSQDQEVTTIKPFNKSRACIVSTDSITNEFTLLERDDKFVYAPGYPEGKIAIDEFSVAPISIHKLKKYFEKNESMTQLLEKAYQDSYVGKGNTFCINMTKYKEYIVNNTTSKLERIGDPVFNRTTRHTVPIPGSFTREEFEQCPSFPAPIGIRAEDFTFPSEQNDILKDLLTQIFNCVNAPECPQELKDEIGLTVTPNSHMCEWCGSLMDISELNQTYCSKEHSVNFCHRDPIIGTKKGNVYIGHCSCNREQGGYSEEQRIQQMIRLAKYNTEYRDIILKALA